MESRILFPTQHSLGIELDTISQPAYAKKHVESIEFSVPDGDRLYISTGGCKLSMVPAPERSIKICNREAYIALSLKGEYSSRNSPSFWVLGYTNGKEVFRRSFRTSFGAVAGVLPAQAGMDFIKIALRVTGSGIIEEARCRLFFPDADVSYFIEKAQLTDNRAYPSIEDLTLHFCLYKRFLACSEGEKSSLKAASELLTSSMKDSSTKEAQYYREISNGLNLEIRENAGDTIALWEDLISENGPYTDDIRLIVGRRYATLGRLEKALKSINNITPSFFDESEAKKIRSMIDKRKRKLLHSDILDLYAAYQEKGLSAPFLLRSALEVAYPGKSDLLLKSFELLTHYNQEIRFDRKEFSSFELCEKDEASPICRAIFTSGFGWSGTGAVNDFLSSGLNVALPMGKSENGFFLGRPGVPGLKDVSRESLWKFLLYSVFMLDSRSILPRCIGNAEKFQAFNSEIHSLRHSICDLIRTDTDRDFDESILKKALGIFFLKVGSRLAANDGKNTMLFNNLVNVSNLELFRFLPDATLVIVRRDPRDQFVSQVLERRKGAPTASQFIRSTLKILNSFDKKVGAFPDMNCRVIFFEDFVLQKQVRLGLASALSVEVPEDGTKFNPEVSARNIGLYKNFKDKESIKEIELAMSDYLWSRNE